VRVEYLSAHSSWAFNGRLAYSHLGEGGSAKIQWQQNKTGTEVKLSSALNLGSVIFTVKDGIAQIKSSDGGLKQGDPEELMQELLKTPLPYSTIASGLRADWPGIPDESIAWQDGLPLQVVTQGWTWQYQEWLTSPAVLPRKIELSQDQTRLRIVIDQWWEIDND
jgi:outer membrane biogenesis lipoprotein LolB